MEKQFVEALADTVCDNLIEAISKIKKINDLGKESLINDVTYLENQVQKILDKKPTNFKTVREFIEAYGYSREDLLSFIKRSAET